MILRSNGPKSPRTPYISSLFSPIKNSSFHLSRKVKRERELGKERESNDISKGQSQRALLNLMNIDTMRGEYFFSLSHTRTQNMYIVFRFGFVTTKGYCVMGAHNNTRRIARKFLFVWYRKTTLFLFYFLSPHS